MQMGHRTISTLWSISREASVDTTYVPLRIHGCLVYLLTWIPLIFYGFHVGEYTGRHMDASWVWDGVLNPLSQDAKMPRKKHVSLTSWV